MTNIYLFTLSNGTEIVRRRIHADSFMAAMDQAVVVGRQMNLSVVGYQHEGQINLDGVSA